MVDNKEITLPYSLLCFSPEENADHTIIFKDSNTLYKQLMEEHLVKSTKSTHSRMLNNLENQVNTIMSLNKPKSQGSTRRNSALKVNKSVNITHRQVQRLQNENISKLNKSKAKDKNELNTVRKKCIDDTSSSVLRLHEEIFDLRNELKQKDVRINELLLENAILKNNSIEIDNLKKCMQKLIELGSAREMHSDSSEKLFKELKNMIVNLVNEKNIVERKYVKILELHNNLIKENGKYTIEYIYKIMDENEEMKKKLRVLSDKKMYIIN